MPKAENNGESPASDLASAVASSTAACGAAIANPLDNSRPLDVHRWSDHPEAKAATKAIFDEAKAAFELSGNEGKFKKTLRVVILDLTHRRHEDPDGYIAYSRNRNSYAIDRRYNTLFIEYRPLIRVVGALEELGYIENQKGFLDRAKGIGRQARMRATPKLIEILENDHHLSPAMISKAEDEEVIILRDKKKKPIPYIDKAETKRMRSVVHRYMDQLNRTYIDIVLKGYSGAEALRIDLNDKFIRRIFNNGSWNEGGRFYGGWWQRIPRELRKRIVMQGKETREIDFSAMHIVILYALKGIDYFGSELPDPYEILGFPSSRDCRDLFKLILLTAVNAESQSAAIKAVRREISEKRDDYPSGVDLKSAISAFKAMHSPISEYFYSGFGTKLQYYDSMIAEKVIEEFMKPDSIGVPPLVIHDSFITRHSWIDELYEAMEKSLNEVLRGLGCPSAIHPKMKTITWEAYEKDRESVEDPSWDVSGLLAREESSETIDSDQDKRRTKWNDTGWLPVIEYRPPQGG